VTFLGIRFLDIIDIFLVAFLLYQLYRMIKGTVAINIFIGLFFFIITWLLVKALDMKLIGSIFDAIVSVGVIAMIILFQEEIRRFFLLIGSKYKFKRWVNLDNMMAKNETSGMMNIYINPLVEACENMASTKTGALIIITKSSELLDVIKTGVLVNAFISSQLIENIFFNNSPMHDGAIIITDNKIKAAQCILPISHNTDLPKNLGLRHRAGLGISQRSDAMVIIISEERGEITFAHNGKLTRDITPEKLTKLLNEK
jgi:diadenylate cyclase